MKMPKMELLMRRLMGVLCVTLLPLVSFGVRVADLPVGGYADMEVAPNLPFRVSLGEMSRGLAVVRRGDVSSSACVEIVGRKPGVAIIIW